jgi:uncharacterized protein YdcH (DUF465 family)
MTDDEKAQFRRILAEHEALGETVKRLRADAEGLHEKIERLREEIARTRPPLDLRRCKI